MRKLMTNNMLSDYLVLMAMASKACKNPGMDKGKLINFLQWHINFKAHDFVQYCMDYVVRLL